VVVDRVVAVCGVDAGLVLGLVVGLEAGLEVGLAVGLGVGDAGAVEEAAATGGRSQVTAGIGACTPTGDDDGDDHDDDDGDDPLGAVPAGASVGVVAARCAEVRAVAGGAVSVVVVGTAAGARATRAAGSYRASFRASLRRDAPGSSSPGRTAPPARPTPSTKTYTQHSADVAPAPHVAQRRRRPVASTNTGGRTS
jgi:hypothetical protein